MTLTAAWLCFGAVKDKAAELELDKVIETIKQNKDADAYVFDYRIYYDVFVKKSGLDNIESIIAPAS